MTNIQNVGYIKLDSLQKRSIQFRIMRNCSLFCPRLRFFVKAKEDMLVSVAHEQKFYVQEHIVRGNLQKNFFRELNVLRFILHYHARSTVWGIKDAVATQLFVADAQFHFVTHQRCRVTEESHKPMHHMLSHPLLRREGNKSATQDVKHFWLAVLRRSYSYIFVLWKVHYSTLAHAFTTDFCGVESTTTPDSPVQILPMRRGIPMTPLPNRPAARSCRGRKR